MARRRRLWRRTSGCAIPSNTCSTAARSRNYLPSKGGTSLSKAFHLIQRFSEDVDLILDWRALGYGRDEPWDPRSNSAQERFKAEASRRTREYLGDTFVPALEDSLGESLGCEVSVHAGDESETVWFDYPWTYESPATLDSIKLEIGPLAARSPSEEATIVPYSGSVMPDGSEAFSTTVRTVSPQRAFWEKKTIVQQEAVRPEGKRIPRRCSRHRYDLYRLGNSPPVLEQALDDTALLARVVDFKEKFYHTPWARLSEARPGFLRLVPSEFRIEELEADYRSMAPMFFDGVSYVSGDRAVHG